MLLKPRVGKEGAAGGIGRKMKYGGDRKCSRAAQQGDGNINSTILYCSSTVPAVSMTPPWCGNQLALVP